MSPAERLLVVNAADTLGQLWGTSFPAYVFRNGLAEALAFCRHRPERAFQLDFVETESAPSCNAKGSPQVTEAEVVRLIRENTALRYSAADPPEVQLHVR